MTFVVLEDCIRCKHTDCVEVCPVDCFYEGPDFLVINPDECIDMTALNAELARHPNWTQITESRDPLPDHEQWRGKPGKLALLDRNGA